MNAASPYFHKNTLHRKLYTQGFTLLELLLVVSIASIMVVIALPNMKNFLDANRNSAFAHELSSHFYFAKTEAIKRKRTVYICPANDQMNGCRNSRINRWTNGWLIYADCNGNAQIDNTPSCDLDGDGNPESYEVIKKRTGEAEDTNLIIVSPS